ncbi:DUF805 domain-containing protein [Brevundimonas sp.]|uniref:DUF805 domain-containing protein n=1 Tax=Brevundimonas sp. TaxID=1871086 RepID=UPI0035B02C9F
MIARAGRLEWWGVFITANVLGGMALRAGETLLMPTRETLDGAETWRFAALAAFNLAVLAVMLGFQHRVSIRRARDREASDVSFRAYAVASVTSVALAYTSRFFAIPSMAELAVWVALLGVALWMIVELGIRPGHNGPNRWGAPPRPYISTMSPKEDNYRLPRN